MKIATFPNYVTYISIKDVMCDPEGCITMIGNNSSNDLVVWDKSHLTTAGSNYVVEAAIKPVLVERFGL